jgi:hypothetical protein
MSVHCVLESLDLCIKKRKKKKKNTRSKVEREGERQGVKVQNSHESTELNRIKKKKKLKN